MDRGACWATVHGVVKSQTQLTTSLSLFTFMCWKRTMSRLYIVNLLMNLRAEHNMRNARLDKTQAGTKTARGNINNLRHADETTLMAESEELKSLLMKVKEESEKVGLKLNIQGIWSHHLMANRWGKQWLTLLLGAPKSLQMVTAAMKLKDTCSLEGKL